MIKKMIVTMMIMTMLLLMTMTITMMLLMTTMRLRLLMLIRMMAMIMAMKMTVMMLLLLMMMKMMMVMMMMLMMMMLKMMMKMVVMMLKTMITMMKTMMPTRADLFTAGCCRFDSGAIAANHDGDDNEGGGCRFNGHDNCPCLGEGGVRGSLKGGKEVNGGVCTFHSTPHVTRHTSRIIQTSFHIRLCHPCHTLPCLHRGGGGGLCHHRGGEGGLCLRRGGGGVRFPGGGGYPGGRVHLKRLKRKT